MTTFYNSNGDSGAAESSAIQPVQNTEPVAPSVTNRPTENLRLRTDVLRYDLEAAQLALNGAALYSDDGPSTTVPLAINWDGPYDPSGSSVPAVESTGSGCIWLGGGLGLNPDARIILQPTVSPPSTQAATYTISYTSGLALTFTADTSAARGANKLRVRVFSVTGAGDLTGMTKVHVTWTHPLPALQDQAVPGNTIPVTAPAALTTSPSTLTIQVRSDGTTLVSDIKTALATAYPSAYVQANGTPVLANAGPMVILTANEADSTAVPATFDGTHADSGYIRLMNGADSVHWTLSGSTLQSFFDSGLVNTTTTGAVGATGSQTVGLNSVTNISVGTLLDFDSGGSFEQVTVTAVTTSPKTVTAVFTKTHGSSAPVKARPNGIRSGDTLVLDLGDGKDRLKAGILSQSNLVNLRIGGVPQEHLVYPLVVCPTGFTTAIIGGVAGVVEGASYSLTDGRVLLAGDLLGPGSTPSVPRVVLATSGAPGVIQMAGDLAGSGSTATDPKVVVATTSSNGLVKLLQAPGSSSAPVVVNVDANNTATVTASGGNANAFVGTGNGTGSGATFYGGSNGIGANAIAGGGNNSGLTALGHGTGAGIAGTGGATDGAGGYFVGGGSNGNGASSDAQGSGAGFYGNGGLTGTGVIGRGGTTSGPGGSFVARGGDTAGAIGTGHGAGQGVAGVADLTGAGVTGTGGSTSGAGGDFTALAGDSAGVIGHGSNLGAGVAGTGGVTGSGVTGTGGSTSGAGGTFTATAGNSSGVVGVGVGSGAGVSGSANDTGSGVVGTGGATSGPGGSFTARAGNSDGVMAVAHGSGAGLAGTADTTGPGVSGTGGSTSGAGGSFSAVAGNSAGVVGVGHGSGAGGSFTAGGSGAAVDCNSSGQIVNVVDPTSAQAVATKNYVDTAVTPTSAVSSSCGSFTTSSTSEVGVPNLFVTITCRGRPLLMSMQPDTANDAEVHITGGADEAVIEFYRDSTLLGAWNVGSTMSTKTPISLMTIDTSLPTGTPTFSVKTFVRNGSDTIHITGYTLAVCEF